MAANVGKLIKTLTKLGVTVGPVMVPVIQGLLQDPEKLNELQKRVSTFTQKSGASADEMLETIEVLRSQVTELGESSEDEKEFKRVQKWAQQLDRFEKGAKLLQAPGAPKKDLKELRKKIDTLRSEILNAQIMDLDEDDEDDDAPPRRRLQIRRPGSTKEG